MLNILKYIGTSILKFITSSALRLLTLFSLLIPVICCLAFIYGLYVHSAFYVLSSALGGVVFTWINKQT